MQEVSWEQRQLNKFVQQPRAELWDVACSKTFDNCLMAQTCADSRASLMIFAEQQPLH